MFTGKPEFFDTHAHFEGDESATHGQLVRAFDAGVNKLMAVGGSRSLNRGADLAASCAVAGQTVLRAIGWDCQQTGLNLPDLDYAGAAAVGEIGLDYHYYLDTGSLQRDLFARQLELSVKLGLPVVIHTREADDDTLGVLRETHARGVIHCFTGTPAFCRALLDLGFFISFSGIVTFRAADNVRESALVVPDDRLLIETDSPFLAPVPLRGRPNEPAFVVHVADFLARLRGVTTARLAETTTRNAQTLFTPNLV